MVNLLDFGYLFHCMIRVVFLLYKLTLEQVLYDFSMIPFVTTEASLWSYWTAVSFLYIGLHETSVSKNSVMYHIYCKSVLYCRTIMIYIRLGH